MEGKIINNEKAREILDHNWTRVVNPDYTEIELGQVQDTAIKALEVLDKIKEKYIQYNHLYSNSVEDRNNFRNVFANAVCNIMYETYRDDTFKI